METNSIGDAIASCRKDKSWSQQALGNKFLPPKSTSEISRWERNEVKPSAKHLAELVGIFGDNFVKLISSRRQTSQAK